MQALKVVVVGDGAVGKTTFLISLTLGCFPTDYIPTTLDNYNAVYPLEGRPISLGLWDTAGQSDFDSLRPISYKAADVVLLFYSVVNPTSAENIKEKWVLDAHQRENPKILTELSERNLKPLTKADGKRLAKEINAVSYMECSAKANSTGYRAIFDTILRFVICEVKQGKKQGKHCWSIDCRQKMGNIQRVKCQGRCKHFYCPDCIEIWEDSFKGCPQCVIYEREEREQNQRKQSALKKSRVPPAVRAAEQLEKERIREEKEKVKAEKNAKKSGEKSPNPDILEKSDVEKSDSRSKEKKKEKKPSSGAIGSSSGANCDEKEEKVD